MAKGFEELLKEFREAVTEWRKKTLAAHRAQAEFEFAEKKLTLIREGLIMEAWSDDDPTMHLSPNISSEMRPVEFLGLTLKQATEKALRQLGTASTDDLVDHMTRGGYRFTGAAPAREVHGAIFKQRWAKRSLWNDSTRTLLDRGHAKGRSITLATALDGVGIPLHPGAERFYREAGLIE